MSIDKETLCRSCDKFDTCEKDESARSICLNYECDYNGFIEAMLDFIEEPSNTIWETTL